MGTAQTAGTATSPDVTAEVGDLDAKGITAARGAFPTSWVDRMHEDVLAAFEDARSREFGTISRGPNRWYVEVHPEQLRGFADLVSHPWVDALCRTVLGADYRFVEIGFDVPFAGAVDQPWHRDFRSPEATWRDHRLTSLAFNLTTVDTTPDMGPFQIAPGTHWEPGQEWEHGMFPPRSEWPRFEAASELRMPRRGDVSARSALALHRGTANHSPLPRPVVILGAVSAEVHEDRHGMTVTRPFWESLGSEVQGHIDAVVVDELTPFVQRHTIEGLVMGVSEEP